MCVFCYSNDDNEIKCHEEVCEVTKNFIIRTDIGSLVEGYLLIVSKRHINSMSALNDEEKEELKFLINSYSNYFYDIYGKKPLFFEHGTSDVENSHSASSVTHAHLHIVNHKYNNDRVLIENEHLEKKSIDECLEYKNKDYIMYIDNDLNSYISYDFDSTSQLLRLYLADDLGMREKYNWREYIFIDNMNASKNKIVEYLNKKRN